jgi:7-cyano-7-deazaguanine synthase
MSLRFENSASRTSVVFFAMKQKLVTVLFSGGIDSTACVRFFMDRGYDVCGVFVNFGQAAVLSEARAVETLKVEFGIPVVVVRAESELSFGAGELVGRNAFLIFAAVLLGGCHDGLLAIGVHAGTPYYDCSPAFIDRANVLVGECTNGRVSVIAPFVQWSKDDVYSFFSTLNLPLSQTYSCEAGSTPPCRHCASCADRMRFECWQSVAP